MALHPLRSSSLFVALLVSAWIEITKPAADGSIVFVALLVSAWIEIKLDKRESDKLKRRTPCECVD